MARLLMLILAIVSADPASAGATLPYAMTSDSEPGWRPPEDLTDEAVEKFGFVLHAMSEGRYEQAYWDYDPSFRSTVTEGQFETISAAGDAATGPMISIEPVFMTWTKPRSGTPLSGIYLALDFKKVFAKAHRACGYVVMHKPPDDANWYVLRTEDHFVTDASYDSAVRRGQPDVAEQLWTEMKARCPHVG